MGNSRATTGDRGSASLPNIRGRGRLALALNGALLKAGADPHAVAKMAAGHSLHVDSRLQNHCWFLFLGANNDEYIRALLRCLRPTAPHWMWAPTLDL